jgi:hypothetical protein
MHIYQKLYEFAASAGSFEGYVYRKQTDEMDMEALANWTNNLLGAYKQMPVEVREELQASIVHCKDGAQRLHNFRHFRHFSSL